MRDLWRNNWNEDRKWSHSLWRIWQQTLACGTLFFYLCVKFSDKHFLTSSHAASYVTYKDRQDHVVFPFSISFLKLWLPCLLKHVILKLFPSVFSFFVSAYKFFGTGTILLYGCLCICVFLKHPGHWYPIYVTLGVITL